MTAPAQLIKPPIQAYPFLSFMFWETSESEDRHFWHGRLKPPSDDSFYKKHYRAPSRVSSAMIAPLAAMSDYTFSKLASIICLSIEGQDVCSKEELAVACAGQIDEVESWCNEGPERYSQEQLQTFLIFNNRAVLHPHWGDLADLYNESTDDQKNAIHGFFQTCLNRSLEKLYRVPAPPLEIPEALREIPQTSMIDGKTMCFSEPSQNWRRDSDYQSSFWIEARNYSDEEITFVATAPTLTEAMALATVFTQRLKQEPDFDHITIDYDRDTIAAADIDDIGDPDGAFVAKLIWDFDWGKSTRFPKETVLNTALEVEKTLGLRWSKVSRLENELGM